MTIKEDDDKDNNDTQYFLSHHRVVGLVEIKTTRGLCQCSVNSKILLSKHGRQSCSGTPSIAYMYKIISSRIDLNFQI